MKHNIRAMLKRANQIRRRQRGIEHERHTSPTGAVCLVRNRCDRLNINQQITRITQRFAKKEPRVRAHRRTPRVHVPGINERRLNAKSRQRVVEQIVRPAVQRTARHNVAACAHQGDDCQMQRRLTRRNRNRPNTALKRRDALLQHSIGRIGEARVNMPSALHVEKRRRVIRILKHE